MKDLQYYINCFTHLHRAHNNGGAPHKPILLLSIIDCIEYGYIADEKIYISSELVAYFRNNWSVWVKSDHIMNFALPFYHMSSEPFWKLKIKTGYDIPLTKSRSIKSFLALQTAVEYAIMDKDLFYLLMQVNERSCLRQTIIDRYFPDIQNRENIAYPHYLNEIAHNILNDPPAVYRKRIQSLKASLNEENYEEDIFLRSAVFKKQIPKIYQNKCCITGLKITSFYNISMIDACHIIPFSETHDDTVGNGIALCPNLHRAFDRGLITINEDYKVIISRNFREESPCSHSIMQFDNKPIILPQNPKYYPKIENLSWHNQNVFR